jgi:hypothetical protein
MAVEPSLSERWRRLFGVEAGVELRIPGDPDRLLVRAWLGARIAPVGPAWVELPALAPGEPGAGERGPPCPGCGAGVDRREPLRGCTACLAVSHLGCAEAGRACACLLAARRRTG